MACLVQITNINIENKSYKSLLRIEIAYFFHLSLIFLGVTKKLWGIPHEIKSWYTQIQYASLNFPYEF